MMIFAPWDAATVTTLNRFQQNSYFHPFTCGNDPCRCDLVATADGWTCPACRNWQQYWAHDFMANADVLDAFDARLADARASFNARHAEE
jgi:hypothetical protein